MLPVDGCVDAPPDYSVPSLVPPVLITSQIDPATTGVASVPATASTFDFDVPFRADDGGQDLHAYFVIDLDPTKDVSPTSDVDDNAVPSDPRPFAEQTGREVSEAWQLPDNRPVGCHTITMILSPHDNFVRSYETRDPLDAAQVTWFLDFLGPTGAAHSCFPTGSVGP